MKLRAALSLLVAVAIVKIGSKLWFILYALDATAPSDATLGGYASGVLFVGMAMWAFAPDFRNSIIIGVLALALAVALWGVQPIYRRLRA